MTFPIIIAALIFLSAVTMFILSIVDGLRMRGKENIPIFMKENNSEYVEHIQAMEHVRSVNTEILSPLENSCL